MRLLFKCHGVELYLLGSQVFLELSEELDIPEPTTEWPSIENRVMDVLSMRIIDARC